MMSLNSVGFWLRDLLARRAAVTELNDTGSEVEHIAHDVGLTAAELRTITERGSQTLLLEDRMRALDLDRRDVERQGIDIMRDMERLCALCDDHRRCMRDLANHDQSGGWKGYCPNAQTLDALRNAKAADPK